MKAFSELAIRLFAAYLVLHNLGNLVPVLITMAQSSSDHSPELQDLPMLVLIGWLVVPLVVGAVLWIKATAISSRLHSTDDSSSVAADKDIVSGGSFLIGLYWGLDSIAQLLSALQISQSLDLGALVVLIASVGLMIGTKHTTSVYQKLRNR